MENIQSNSNDLNTGGIGEGEYESGKAPRDVLSASASLLQNSKDIMDSGGLLNPIDPVIHGESVKSSVINLSTLDKIEGIVSETVKTDIKQKGNKKWKRLARGDLSYYQTSETENSMLGRGKWIREQGEHSIESSEKSKLVLPLINKEIKPAEVVQQPR